MVLTSFRRNSDVQTLTPSFLPTQPTLDNYRQVFERDYFWTAMRNSAMVTAIVVVLALGIAFLAAVALSRFRFRGRKAFLIAVIMIQMIPAEALIISLFQVLDGRQLTNRIIGLSLTYLIFVLPFTIWTLRGFVSGVPLELEEAARVDGASRFGAFVRVTLPLVAPGLVATGIFAFILAWNEFIFALVIMNRPETQTMPVWLQAFNEGARGTDWGGVMAGSTVMALPVVDLLPHRPAQGDGRADGRARSRGSAVTSPIVGVDVGGTSTRAVSFDGVADAARPRPSPPTPRGADRDRRPRRPPRRRRRRRPSSVAIGMPGRVDPARGVVALRRQPRASRRRRRSAISWPSRLGVPVHVENDVNAAALGAFAHLGLAPAQSLAYVNVGTGIAAGFVLGGPAVARRVGRGRRDRPRPDATPHGPPCRCGQAGLRRGGRVGPGRRRRSRAGATTSSRRRRGRYNCAS